MPTYLEFFCGGGMVRAGLGREWDCLFANDFDHKKCATYAKNWGDAELIKEDIWQLGVDDIPAHADLAWASFPCQDLSLAGGGAGLRGDRSGTFKPFWDLMEALNANGRGPTIIALENVCGTLTSHGGKDFAAICSAYRNSGYKVGAIVIDAVHFLPQSRPRLFIIGVKKNVQIPVGLNASAEVHPWHTRSLIKAHSKLSAADRQNWIWWAVPSTRARRKSLIDLVDTDSSCIEWHAKRQTREFLKMMDPVNKSKLNKARALGRKIVGAMYRRTRPNPQGGTIQRIEVRFDGVAGCLRTPAGGSSRQLLIRVEGDDVRTRLLSSREAANLMGLPKSYELPPNYNEAYHLAGDGVAVPVLRHLARKLFSPILLDIASETSIAA